MSNKPVNNEQLRPGPIRKNADGTFSCTLYASDMADIKCQLFVSTGAQAQARIEDIIRRNKKPRKNNFQITPKEN